MERFKMLLQLFADLPEYTALTADGEPLFTMEEPADADSTGDGDGDDAVPEDVLEDGADKDPIFFPRLRAVDKNLPHTQMGALVVADEDGNLLSVEVDETGEAREQYLLIEDDNVVDGALSGAKLQEATITSRELDMEEIFSDSELIKQLLAMNIDAASLFDNEGFIERFDEKHWKEFIGKPLETDDLNDVLEPGRYYRAAATGVQNMPGTAGSFVLDVLKTGEDALQQVFRTGKEAHVRNGTLGADEPAWDGWSRLVDEARLEEALKVKVNKAGDTMTGALTLPGSPTQNLHAATKQYVDAHSTAKNNPHTVTLAQVGAAAASHNHDAGNVTSGTLSVARGGTGQTSLQATRNAMGLGNTAGALPVANGGTGLTSLQATRNAMGLGNTTGVLPVANGGTGRTDGKAVALATPRGIAVDLSSSNLITMFDGSTACNFGVINTLGVARGGTGGANSLAARTNLGIKSGRVSFAITTAPAQSNTTGTIYKVDFQPAFSSLSAIVLTQDVHQNAGRNGLNFMVGDRSNSSFTIRVYNPQSISASGNMTCNVEWIAIGNT